MKIYTTPEGGRIAADPDDLGTLRCGARGKPRECKKKPAVWNDHTAGGKKEAA